MVWSICWRVAPERDSRSGGDDDHTGGAAEVEVDAELALVLDANGWAKLVQSTRVVQTLANGLMDLVGHDEVVPVPRHEEQHAPQPHLDLDLGGAVQ